MSFSVSTAKVGGRMLRGKTSAPGLLLDGVGRSRASSSSAPQESMGRAMHLSGPYVCSMPQPSTPLHTCSHVPYSWFTCHHTPWPSGKPAGYPASSPSSSPSSSPLVQSALWLLFLTPLLRYTLRSPSQCVCVRLFTCTHVCAPICVYLHECVCPFMCTHTCVHLHLCACAFPTVVD